MEVGQRLVHGVADSESFRRSLDDRNADDVLQLELPRTGAITINCRRRQPKDRIHEREPPQTRSKGAALAGETGQVVVRLNLGRLTSTAGGHGVTRSAGELARGRLA